MVRKALPIGPYALTLIEDAPTALVREVLSLQDDGQPHFGLTEEMGDLAEDALRRSILDSLGQFDEEDLRPLEQRCGRIWRLAEGKGVSSLDTIAEQRLNDEQHLLYAGQPDSLCRSIWVHLNFRPAFEDAESFYFARQFRDYGKMYDAFEIELEKAFTIDAASIDESVLATRITQVLELKTSCRVQALDLPATETHPKSIMLIVRHGGPLSSVYDHRDDGRRETIYFRPSNEATLIYTNPPSS